MEDRTHLRRLERVWIEDPIYFITTSTQGRRPLLARPEVAEILIEVWKTSQELYRWSVGRYVIMPDHVHFFCKPHRDGVTLAHFVGKWKEWTAKYLDKQLGFCTPVWQTRFFDHVLRSQESYSSKWEYIWENPVRAGLVSDAEDWKFQGELTEFRGR